MEELNRYGEKVREEDSMYNKHARNTLDNLKQTSFEKKMEARERLFAKEKKKNGRKNQNNP